MLVKIVKYSSSQAASPYIKDPVIPNPILPIKISLPGSLDGIEPFLFEEAKSYLRDVLQITEIYEHMHKGEKAISVKQPKDTQVPIFAITNVDKNPELRIYPTIEDLVLEVPNNSKDNLELNDVMVALALDKIDKISTSQYAYLTQPINDFKSTNGPAPDLLDDKFNPYVEALVDSIVTSPTYNQNILGVLKKVLYRNTSVSNTREDLFTTLTFDDNIINSVVRFEDPAYLTPRSRLEKSLN